MNLFHANEAMEANYSALDPFKTQCVNRIFFESEKIKVIYVIDISEYLQQQQQQQQQVVPKEDVLEVAKSPHACK